MLVPNDARIVKICLKDCLLETAAGTVNKLGVEISEDCIIWGWSHGVGMDYR